MLKTGIPLDRAHKRVQVGTVTLLEPYSLSNKSSVFEVRNTPVVIQAFNLDLGEEVVVLSIVRTPSGADIEQIFRLNGQPITLTSTSTAVLLRTSGRYRVELINGAGNAYVTYTLQHADIGGDVGMPSGAQANRPNVFLDNAFPETTSNVIEIEERPWVFNAYGLGPDNRIEVYQVYGSGPTYREEVYRLDGQAITLTQDSNAAKLEVSGRYRFKLSGIGGGVTLIGNPTTPQTTGDGSGTPGPPGPPGPATPPVVLVAAETIHGRRAVKAVNGQAYHPSINIDDDAEQVIGIALNSSNIGGAVQVRTVGTVSEPSWTWNPGYVYVGSDGVLTQTPSANGWLLSIGKAINATTIDVDVDTAFFRG